MFDISTNSGGIEVHSLSFRVWYGKDANTTSVIDVYTAKEGYAYKAKDSSEWTKIASTTIVSQAWSKVRIEFDEVVNIDNSGDKQAFYIVSSNGAIVAGDYDINPIVSDEHISILTPARYDFAPPFGGGTSSPNGQSISFEGAITYRQKVQEPTAIPSLSVAPSSSPSQTIAPTLTLLPSSSILPSSMPSSFPSMMPSSAPSSSTKPTQYKSSSPSTISQKPSIMPSKKSVRPTAMPIFLCTADSDCDSFNSCRDDTCDLSSGMCQSLPKDDCCGNNVCEKGEIGSCGDCGPFSLSTPICDNCWTPKG